MSERGCQATAFLPGLFLVLFLACAGSRANEPRAELGAPARPEEAGEQLYRSHCAACHRLRDPREQTRARWAWAVDHYGPRAHLKPEERAEVLAYLQAHAKDAPPGAE